MFSNVCRNINMFSYVSESHNMHMYKINILDDENMMTFVRISDEKAKLFWSLIKYKYLRMHIWDIAYIRYLWSEKNYVTLKKVLSCYIVVK